MAKRKIVFGTYDTDLHGLWTLTGWEFSPAEQVTNFVEVPGRKKGPLDLSTALTDGEPVYGSRTLTVTLESSEGTRLEREARINTMANWLDGWRLDITLPDDDAHYITGRIHIAKEYNDPAHCAVTVTAICEPWRYNSAETVATFTATEETQTGTLENSGRLSVVPLLVVSGGDVLLTYGEYSWALGEGSYALPDLRLQQGTLSFTYSGTATITFTYREAVL